MFLTDDQKSSYKEAKLLNESSSDPKTNPYKSKYEGRTILQGLRDEVHQQREDGEDSQDLKYVEATLEYHLGVNYIYTEEVSGGEERLKHVLELIEEKDHLNPSLVSIVVATYNELGVLWSSREGGIDKAYDYLTRSEKLYLDYKAESDEEPLTVHHKFMEDDFITAEKVKLFESLHTHTLYFLAQALKTLEKNDDSAAYCMKTLKRQLEAKTYQAEEWAIHCAGLSQYFICKELFWEGRHCLACAQYIINEAADNCEEADKAKMNEKKGDIYRCWVKYCLNLLEISKEKVSNDIGELDEQLVQLSLENGGNGDEYKSSFDGFALEVTSYEDQVPYLPVSTFDKAKVLFTKGKEFAEHALEEFVLDGFVTDHIEINQDTSRLYQFVAFFEPQPAMKCRMHKRRIDILESMLKELNPQYYLAICRQLQFELAEIHSEMMDLKYNISYQENTRHNPAVIKKINSLCLSSLKYYGNFLQTLKVPDGTYPNRFEDDIERPALVAHFCSARLYSKLIPANMDKKRQNVRKTFENYNFVVNYVERNEEAAGRIEKELQICQDFVRILPSTLEF